MVYGIGVDLIEVERVKKAILANDTFLTKIYGSQEIAKCQSTNNRFQCFAARFAGKEAFMKALGTGWSKGLKWTEVEILNDKEGKPVLTLSGKAKEMIEELNITRLNISLSHIANVASAIVVLETN